MDKFLLITSIPWCLIAVIGVVVAFRDKQYQNRNITSDRLAKQIFFSTFSTGFALAKSAWLAASIWEPQSYSLVSLSIFLIAIARSFWRVSASTKSDAEG